MTKHDKFLNRILSGQSDSNVDFEELCRLLINFGFVERVRGSHHIFVKPGIDLMINLQREGRLAKSYQVRQVRTAITAHQLAIGEEK